MLLIVNLMHLSLSAFGFNNLNSTNPVLKVEEVSSSKTTSRISVLSMKALVTAELRLMLIQRHCLSLTGILDLGGMPLILRLRGGTSLRFVGVDGWDTGKPKTRGRFYFLIRKRKIVSSMPKNWVESDVLKSIPRSEVGVMLWHLGYDPNTNQRYQKLRLWKLGFGVGRITNQLIL
jgi:hypothetical protein